MSLRPEVSAACRAALRDRESPEATRHVAACAFCSARLEAEPVLGAFAAATPAAPAALARPEFLEGIYERAVEQAEHGPVGQWVEASARPVAELDTARIAPDAAWVAPSLESELAQDLMRPPVSPDPEVWSNVRQTILDEVSAEAGLRRLKPFAWRAALAGAAAAAIIGMIAVSEGTKEAGPIVFTELGEAPDVPIVIVRYGVRD
ncbi:MAG: hypothetical protein KAI24_16595 [Planctomycetes bacterium]|nr:hypothetical protein [Planctomycetota bacterium]